MRREKDAPGRAMLALRRRPIVRALAAVCARQGYNAWIVGGALRDAALGMPPAGIVEIDAAVDGDPEPLARELEAEGRGRAVFLSKDRPGPRVFRVAAGRTELDLAAVEGATIEEDLARRDFTANALALPVAAGAALDPFGGQRDISRGALRGVRERNFHDDPLRSLRAARIYATRGLTPDAELLRWARGAAPALPGVAAERVSAELAKLLAAPCVRPALAWAARAGVLPGALGLPLPRAGTSRLVGATAALDGAGVRALSADRRRRLRLAWIASRLAMDHAAARRWLAGRRWGRHESEEVAALVALAARVSGAPRGDAAWRWVLEAGPLAEDAARLAALLSPRARPAAGRLARLARRPRRAVAVSGNDVMTWTGIAPGPRVGALLSELAVAAAAGRVRNRTQARHWLSVQVSNSRNPL
jgi:tRNA nucleotidyltransferase/poly(A) polymerase